MIVSPCATLYLSLNEPTNGGVVKMSRTLIIIGIALVAIGVLWPWLAKMGIGQLPGDIMIKRDNFVFYAPLTSGLLVSFVLSAVFWLLSR
jgi:Protein of unknown function (DUF2905)